MQFFKLRYVYSQIKEVKIQLPVGERASKPALTLFKASPFSERERASPQNPEKKQIESGKEAEKKRKRSRYRGGKDWKTRRKEAEKKHI